MGCCAKGKKFCTFNVRGVNLSDSLLVVIHPLYFSQNPFKIFCTLAILKKKTDEFFRV